MQCRLYDTLFKCFTMQVTSEKPKQQTVGYWNFSSFFLVSSISEAGVGYCMILVLKIAFSFLVNVTLNTFYVLYKNLLCVFLGNVIQKVV